MNIRHLACGLFVLVIMVQNGVALDNKTQVVTLTAASFDNEIASKPHFVLFFAPG